MNRHHHILRWVCCAALLFAACDRTIHEYPQSDAESVVLIELNVDRLPPRYYKELHYDDNGNYIEIAQAPDHSDPYMADERLTMRVIVELYRLSTPTARVEQGTLVERREVFVERLKEAPQDTVQFLVPAGTYRALTWADYVPTNNMQDWHFTTAALNTILVDANHHPRDNHHKSSAAGSCNFSVDFDQSSMGAPVLLEDTRATRVDNNVVPVGLQRASGRYRIWATDLEEFLNSGKRIEDLRVRIVYKQYISAGYNVDTETPNQFVATHTIETAPTTLPGDGTVLLAYDYVLTSTDRENKVLADLFIYENDTELNHYQNITIPLYRNRETVIKGPFLTREVGSGDIGIDDGFDDETVVVIPD